MQWIAFVFIETVDTNFLSEMKECGNFVVLGCQMKSIEACAGFCQNIRASFLQVSQRLSIAIVGGIEQRCEGFVVLLVDPKLDFLFGIPGVELFGLSNSAGEEQCLSLIHI